MSWEEVKIEDIFNVARGGSPRPIDNFITDNENGVNWIMIGDTKDGGKYINSTAKRIKAEGVKKSREVKRGDFLLTNSMSFGRPYILNVDGCIHDGWLVLSPYDSNINTDYFYYYLGSNEIKAKLSAKAAGAVVKNLNKDLVKSLKIQLPPYETQKKIAAILDAADAYRQKTKTLIEKYDELTQSLFLEMFGDAKLNEKGWPIIFLEDACEEVIDCPHSTPKYVEKETEFPCIRTTELDKGSINWSKMKYLDHQGYLERTKRLIPQEGDIIYGREGSFGDAVIVPESCKMSLGQRVMLFRPNLSHVNSYFLHALVRSTGVYHQALRVNSGSTVGHVNVKDIKKFKLILPPISLQNEFSSCIQKIKAQKAQAQKSLEKAEELFNSLLQRAFKGELV